MRVLEVLDTYYPKFDGPTMVITSYCKHLNKIDGVQAEVCVPKFPKYVDDQPFPVFRVKSLKGPEGYYYGIPAFDSKLKKYLKENKFDLIHIHSPFTMCSFFAKYAKKHNIPTIFTFHTQFHGDFDRMLKLKITKKIAMHYIMKNINKVDHVVAVSEGAAKVLKSYGYKKDVGVIRNGTDLHYPDNAEELKTRVSELYHFKKDETIFLSVGRLVVNKNTDFSLEVMAKLKEKGLHFKYLIVGSGPHENNLKEHVKALGLEDCVVFTGKIMDRELLSAHYLCSNLFIFPSVFDTSGLVVYEAASMKLPSMVTEGSCPAEAIIDGRNGLTAKENDVDDWANKIETTIKQNKLHELSQKAFDEVQNPWENVTQEVYRYYLDVLKKKENKD